MHALKVKLRRMVQVAMDVANLPYGQFCQVDPNTDTVSPIVAISSEASAKAVAARPWAIAPRYMEDIYHRGSCFVGRVEDLYPSIRPPIMQDVTKMMGFFYVAVIPVRSGRDIFGAISLYGERPVEADQVKRIKNVVQLAENQVWYDRHQHGAGKERAMVIAEERFRREVAEQLHGRVQTKLFLLENSLQVLLNSATISNSDAIYRLQSIQNELKQVRDRDIRHLSHRLHPGLIRVALRPALRLLENQFQGLTEVHFVISPAVAAVDTPIENGFSERTRLVAYRVIEESLLNAVRHGMAEHVTIELGILKGCLFQVRVIDDGQGFQGPPTGLGLQLMKSRVHSVNGTLSIRSSVSSGTEVEALIPMRTRYRKLRRSIAKPLQQTV